MVGFAVLALMVAAVRAQFFDDFDAARIDGWFTMTGDGAATVKFVPHDGFARIEVDATQDRHNVWWTIIKRDVGASLDLEKLKDPAYELRVEARIWASHAPRRVNFMLNTQRTTDFHEHLREYDIADTSDWHVISMTTRNFDAAPGDQVFVQLGVTDWGWGKYHVDVDYYRADVVRRDAAEPDRGEPLVYHPSIPDLKTFQHHLGAAHDSVINTEFPEVNFNDWHVQEADGVAPVLTVTSDQWAVLRWDFGEWKRRSADGAGVLELTTSSAPLGGNYTAHFGADLGIEFGKIRVIEILGGPTSWKQDTVTYATMLGGARYEEVFNPQMISDVEVATRSGGRTYVTISRPVLQRLLDGTTKGLLLRPLGAMAATFYASEQRRGDGPKLHFNVGR